MAALWYHSKSTRQAQDWAEKRKSARKPVNRPAVFMAVDGDQSVLGRCMILDISQGGARLQVDNPSQVPQIFRLILSPGARATRRCHVRWRSATEIGVQFQPE
jgi:hypothetical protein